MGGVSVSQINIELPLGIPVEQTQQKINEIAKQLKDRPEILSTYTIADDSKGVAQHKGLMILFLRKRVRAWREKRQLLRRGKNVFGRLS